MSPRPIRRTLSGYFVLWVVLLSWCMPLSWAVEEVNESVLSAINERLKFHGAAPVVWPNNLAGQTPTESPPTGFYKDDNEATKAALFSSAKSHTISIAGSFLYFPGDTLPNDLGDGIGTPTAPSASPPDVSLATTWNDLVMAMKKMKYAGHSGVQVKTQSVWDSDINAEYDPEWDPWSNPNYNHTVLEYAQHYQQLMLQTDYSTEFNNSNFLTTLMVYVSAYVTSYGAEDYIVVGAGRNRSRFVVPSDPARNTHGIAVFLRGVRPESLYQGHVAAPEIVTADGRYHLFKQEVIPVVGEWVDPVAPPLVDIQVDDPEWFPGGPEPKGYHDVVGYSRACDNAPPIGIAIGNFRYPSAGPPAQDNPETTCDSSGCPPGSGTTGSDAGVGQVVHGSTSSGTSLIDNIRFNYRHWADDYRSAEDPAACRSCAGGSGAPASHLPCLAIRRIHRYDRIGSPSSMGPGVFLAQDISLHVVANGVIDIIDPQANLPVRLTYDTGTSLWGNRTHNLAAGVDISGGQPTVGGTAVYTQHNGNSYHFTFINDGSPNLRARLTETRDRNGNAISISYVHPATASDADLGGNRANLWKIASITDAHGLSAIVTYDTTLVAGRPVISRIDLPNGSHIEYQYQQPALGFADQDLVGFSGALLPGGDVVTVSATRENGLVRIAFDDPGAEGIHRRKTVWLTEPGSLDPRSGLVASYRIREARLATGEVAYRCRLEQDGTNWQSIVQEGARLLRLVHTAQGRIQRTDYATAWDWSQPTSTYTWDTVGTYIWDSQIRPTEWTNAAGKHFLSTPDALRNAPARIDHADTTYSATTWGPFQQPLSQRDRTGRTVTATYDGNGNRETETVASGTAEAATTEWTYNGRGQVLTEKDPLGAVTEHTYTTAGFLETTTEPPDAYPPDGPPVAGNPVYGVPGIEPSDFPYGSRATWTFEYDTAGRRTAMIDPRSHLPVSQRRTTFGWDARNRLTSTTYPDGSTETTTYGTGILANLVVRTKDRNGRITAYDYDDNGRRMATTLYANEQDYDAHIGEVIASSLYLPGTTRETDRWVNGERTQIGYDQRGRATSTTVWANASTALTTSTAYDAADRPWLETDAFNRRTIRLYDDEGNVQRTIREAVVGALSTPLPTLAELAALPRLTTANPAYVIEDMTYDAEDRLATRTDGRGIRTDLVYNHRGDLADEIVAVGQGSFTTHLDYDLAGRRVAVTSPRQVVTRTDYTMRGLELRVTEAYGSDEATVVTERSYSATRKLRLARDANGGIREQQYGGCCDRMLVGLDELQFETHLTYDFVGNRRTVLDPNQLLTDTTYDARNRVRIITNAELETTETVYDDNLTDGVGLDANGSPLAPYLATLGFAAGTADGAAVAVYNPLRDVTFTVHDGLGRPVLRLEPGNRVTRIAYDQVVIDTGAPVAETLVATVVTDPMQHSVAQWADGLGRTRVLVDATGAKTRQGWDAVGNQTRSRDPNQVGLDRVYNARNLLASQSDTREGAPVTTGWDYDLDGNRVAETITIDGAAKTETYGFDLRNRRRTLLDRLNGLTKFDYDLVGNLTDITDAEGGVTHYVYDARNLLTSEKFPGSTGGTRTYSYDPGRRLLTRKQQGAPVAGGN